MYAVKYALPRLPDIYLPKYLRFHVIVELPYQIVVHVPYHIVVKVPYHIVVELPIRWGIEWFTSRVAVAGQPPNHRS